MKFILLEAITGEKVAIDTNEIISVSEKRNKHRIELVTKTETWYISDKYRVEDIVKSIEKAATLTN